jgi:plasmid stabilization system protein ParE
VKVRWSAQALRDIEEIYGFASADKPGARENWPEADVGR